MTEEIKYDASNEMASNDVASIISSTSSEYDPVKEIALQLGVEYIDYPDFEDVVTIKEGKNILVKRAIWKEESRIVALKYIFGEDMEEQHKILEDEIMRALQNLDDDNLMQLYGVSQDLESARCMLVLQYADSGNLRECLEQKELPWFNRLRIARDIAYGLRQLHKAGVVHGDLHLQNIFVDNGKAFIRAPRMVSPDDTSYTYYNSAPKTIPYVDPKIVHDTNSLPVRHSDIYSLGVILWEISCNKPQFKDQTRLSVEAMIQKSREQTYSTIPEEYIKLLQDCWNVDPEMRPSIEQICKQLNEFLRDDPDSEQFKETEMDESEEEFTFDESIIPVLSSKDDKQTESMPILSSKDDKQAESIPVLSSKDDKQAESIPVISSKDDKQANGHTNSQPLNPPVSDNSQGIRRRSNNESTINQRPKRYSKIYQTLKFDFQQTKTKVLNVLSKMSCMGSKVND